MAIEVMHHEDGEVGVAAGLLMQALPDGDEGLVRTMGATLHDLLVAQMREHGVGLTADLLATGVFGAHDLELLDTTPVQWKCSCSREKVLDTIISLGKAEVQDMLWTDGKASVTCQFCNTTHVASAADLTNILSLLGATPSA